MSLSARIVLRPSRRLAICETLAAIGGLLVAAVPLVQRWQAEGLLVATIPCLVAVAIVTSRRSRSAATVVVADRSEVGLSAIGGGADEGSWRLAEATMVWPGFCVVALACEGRRRRTMAVLDRELPSEDRRALHRYLLWSLRGGAGRRPANA